MTSFITTFIARTLSMTVRIAIETLAKLMRFWPVYARRLNKIAVERDIPYRDTGSRRHRMDFYKPRGRPVAAMLLIHGGGFKLFSKDTHWPYGLLLAELNVLVAVTNIRLSADEPYPASQDDSFFAWKEFTNVCLKLGFQPEQLLIGGVSSGANLAHGVVLGLANAELSHLIPSGAETSVRPAGFLGSSGFYELTNLARFGAKPSMRKRLELIAHHYVGKAAEQGKATPFGMQLSLLKSMACIEHVPTLLTCGRTDIIAPDSVELHQLLTAQGLPATLHVYPNAGHAFEIFMGSVASLAWLDDVRTWLSQTVKRNDASTDATGLPQIRPLFLSETREPRELPRLPHTRWDGHKSEFLRDRFGFLQRLPQQIGDIGLVRVLLWDWVAINEPNMAHEILAQKASHTWKGRIFPLFARALFGRGLVLSEGAHHKRQRARLLRCLRHDMWPRSDPRLPKSRTHMPQD